MRERNESCVYRARVSTETSSWAREVSLLKFWAVLVNGPESYFSGPPLTRCGKAQRRASSSRDKWPWRKHEEA
jgi:hypothetical protein